MNTDARNILLRILEAIEYTGDKETFVKEFAELAQIQAAENLISKLPQEQQESIKTELSTSQDNPEKASEVLKSHFNNEQMQKALEESSKNTMVEWMQALKPTLSDPQRQKLLDLSGQIFPQATV